MTTNRPAGPDILAISVGNTRTRVGVFVSGELHHSASFENPHPSEVPSLAGRILEAAGWRATEDNGATSGSLPPSAPVVMASVNNPVADTLADVLRPALLERGGDLYRFGDDLDVPISNSLRDDSTVGQDRLLNALGAFARSQQACIVVDAGTAVTVDFVDGQGVFQGGAILPGLHMMLKALHEHTAALPLIPFEPGLFGAVARAESAASESSSTSPGAGGNPFGRDTREAMILGVRSAVVGAVRVLVERYSEFYGAFPQIIATGGDARALFEEDDLVEHVVPDLTLMGIHAACAIELGDGGDED